MAICLQYQDSIEDSESSWAGDSPILVVGHIIAEGQGQGQTKPCACRDRRLSAL